jgi:TonB family protein
MSIRLALIVATAVIGSAATAAQQPRPTSPVAWVDLHYPAEALAARTAGFVVVRATTDATGRVTGVESLAGADELARATVANVRQWTLATKAGSDVLVFRFDIEHGKCNDDSRSLFRLVHPDLAVITACTGANRKPGGGYPRDWWMRVPEAPAPAYPQIAQSARFTGVVVLEVSIGADGRVTDARPLNRAVQWFSDVAVADLKTWRSTANPRPPGFNTVFVYEFALGTLHCQENPRSTREWVLPQYTRLTGCTPTASH